MLLRASSQALGDDADLRATLGELDDGGDGGVENGALLAAFAEAVVRGSDDLDDVRQALVEAIGPAQSVEAAATVGIFDGLVRTADSTGIPIDEGRLKRSAEVRAELGINRWSGARSSGVAEEESPAAN